jgi:hypothetical protein
MNIDLDKVRYMYFGNRGSKHTHAITIAYTRDDHKIYFGVAFCNNEDVYDKKYGKELAVSRLHTNGDDGIDIVEGSSVCETIWKYLYSNKRGTRLTYNKPSWVNDILFIHKLQYNFARFTTRELYEDQNRGFISRVLNFFGVN